MRGTSCWGAPWQPGAVVAAVLALSSAVVCLGQAADGSRYHLVLEGGTIYDGRGGEPYRADVGIVGDRITAIGDLDDARAAERLDVSGLAVTPGFIDIHSHAVRGVFRHPLAENYTRQGVTTVIEGPDGSSPLPIGDFLARIDLHPPAINFGLTVGHGTIRGQVMGNEDRAPTEDELEAMKQLVEQAMSEGAFGLSTGLKYVPGAYATTEEVIALARVAARFGGFHASHMREEGLELLAAVEETIRIGEEGGLPTQLTHHKVVGAPMWGASEQSLALVDAARSRGVDVTIDQYPYTASSTSLSILFPAWSLEGEPEDLLARLRDPDTRARIKAGIVENLRVDRGGGHPKNVVISQCEWDPSLNGMSLADILARRGEARDDLEAAAELALELQEKGGFSGIFHAMQEHDVIRIMRHPQTMIASDGGIVAPGEGVPHPRNYGTFARVLGHYARDEGVLSLPEAIRKMSSLPADRLGLADRGRLGIGGVADIAVFAVDEIDDPAAFGDPHHYAQGARHVLVGGVFVLLDGEVTGARPGRPLRRGGSGRRSGELPKVHVVATGGTIASATDGGPRRAQGPGLPDGRARRRVEPARDARVPRRPGRSNRAVGRSQLAGSGSEDVRRGAVRSLEEAIDLRVSHRRREGAEETAGAHQDSPVEHLQGDALELRRRRACGEECSKITGRLVARDHGEE